MRCLKPISIYNQSKFIDVNNRHLLKMDVACGCCASCMRNKALEWYFRAYKHFEACCNKGGYVLFDTLTYSDKFVPHLTDFDEFSLLLPHEDFMCFDFADVRLFLSRLRKSLKKFGYKRDVFDYFISSEYGTASDKTHRPHYHVLFFVHAPIFNRDFSRLVANAWWYGRTDGIPYRSASYVDENTFRSVSVGGRRVCNYVSKYVMKHSSFQKTIDKRIDLVLSRIANGRLDYYQSDAAKQVRRRLNRIVNQFHRQSHGFGLSAIDNVDLDELFKRGFFLLPNGKPTMYTRVPISNYYLRKLCYNKVDIDGMQLWLPREDRLCYLAMRDKSITDSYADSLRCRVLSTKINLDNFNNLSTIINHYQLLSTNSDNIYYNIADYYLHWRGRMLADDYGLLSDVRNPRLFVYASNADKNHFGFRFVSNRYLGYKDNYRSIDVGTVIWKLDEFVDENSVNQLSLPCFNGYDDLINELENAELPSNVNKQLQYEHLQHLKDVYDAFY